MPYSNIATGSYTATYNADTALSNAAGKGTGPQDLGLVEDIFLWQRKLQGKLIQSNLQGNFPLDCVYQGGECFCRFTIKQWNASIQSTLWPINVAFDEISTSTPLLSHYAGELTLTVADDTRAEELGPTTVRFGKAIIAEDQLVDISLGEIERDISLIFRCFPYENSEGKQVWFETT